MMMMNDASNAAGLREDDCTVSEPRRQLVGYRLTWLGRVKRDEGCEVQSMGLLPRVVSTLLDSSCCEALRFAFFFKSSSSVFVGAGADTGVVNVYRTHEVVTSPALSAPAPPLRD